MQYKLSYAWGNKAMWKSLAESTSIASNLILSQTVGLEIDLETYNQAVTKQKPNFVKEKL